MGFHEQECKLANSTSILNAKNLHYGMLLETIVITQNTSQSEFSLILPALISPALVSPTKDRCVSFCGLNNKYWIYYVYEECKHKYTLLDDLSEVQLRVN